MTGNSSGKARAWQAWLLAALFFGPLAVAWVLYFDTGWRPGGMTNHGQLVHPAGQLRQGQIPGAR